MSTTPVVPPKDGLVVPGEANGESSAPPTGGGSPIARIREHLKEPLHRSAWAVMFSTVLMSGIGLLFWAFAAHVYSIDAVGRDQAMIFAMMLLASVFQMNMTNAAVRFLPQVRDKLGLRIIQAYGIAAFFSFLAGLAFALIAPRIASEYSFIADEGWITPAFAVATALWAVFLVQDPVLMALGKATWMPAKNSVYSAAKLIMLPLFYVVTSGHGMFLAWIAPLIVIVPAVDYFIARKAVPAALIAQKNASGVMDAFGHPRLLFKFIAQDFVGSSATQIAIYATPLLTLALLGPKANAMYSLPFVIVTGLDALFVAVVTSLTAEGSRSPERIKHLTDLVVRRMIKVQFPASVLVFLVAPLLMLPFPAEYASEGTAVARLIALGGIFRAILLFYEAVARLQGKGSRLMWVQVSNTSILIAFVFVLAPAWGVKGTAASWLFAAMASSVFVLPWLIAFIKNPTVLVSERHHVEDLLEETVPQSPITTPFVDPPSDYVDEPPSGSPLDDDAGDLPTDAAPDKDRD